MPALKEEPSFGRTSSRNRTSLRRRTVSAAAMVAALTVVVPFAAGVNASLGGGDDQVQIETTEEDFYQAGTQPPEDLESFDQIVSSSNCTLCHAGYSFEVAPFDPWITSMMGQSSRDPVWHAALSIANQDIKFGGETCIRCHAPAAWLKGKSFTTDSFDIISEFDEEDFDGINCNFCHRTVNPIPCEDPEHPETCHAEGSATGFPPASGDYKDPHGDPYPDTPIITALQASGDFPYFAGNATYILDPDDMRRGPYGPDEINTDWYHIHGATNGHFIWIVQSPFHRESAFCGQCHDVSNPLFVKNDETGSYELASLADGTPHPTGNPNDMFPEQRTYSEWLVSDFARAGVVFEDDRFGGYIPEGGDRHMRSCQDCHMPKQIGAGCAFEFPNRIDIGQHSFAGANTWVIGAVKDRFEELGHDTSAIGLTQDRIDASKARTVQMLKDASDMELTVDDNGWLNVRIINQTGHKLPTGYPEGRRMWLNVQYFDQLDNLIGESGAYDHATATLEKDGAKIYEMTSGISEEVAKATNLPAGASFHLALNNVRLFDNRIPPRGATQAELEAVGAENIGYIYADNQYWDDTRYLMPEGTRTIVATLYYQTSTREYMEFLMDTSQNGLGAVAHSLWEDHGKSAPEPMDVQAIELPEWIPGDINHDGLVDGIDLLALLGEWGPCSCPADVNGNGDVDGEDLLILLGNWDN